MIAQLCMRLDHNRAGGGRIAQLLQPAFAGIAARF